MCVCIWRICSHTYITSSQVTQWPNSACINILCMSMLKSSLDETLMAMLCLHVMCPQQHSSCALHAMYRFRSTHITCYCTLDQSGCGLFVSNRTTYKQCILDRYILEMVIHHHHSPPTISYWSWGNKLWSSWSFHRISYTCIFHEFSEDVKLKLSFFGKIELTWLNFVSFICFLSW